MGTCLPATWLKIQDCTHLVLVIGVLSCSILIVLMISRIFSSGTCMAEDEILCISSAIVLLIFGAVVFMYSTRIISQYDEQLIAKEAMAKQEKEKLLTSYNNLLVDMDGLLANATESASGLAERSFESKRRDFQRFLERAKMRFSGVYSVDGEMLTQFRRFCRNWLNVFKECSIDPINHPKTVVEEDELMGCTSITEVAEVCLERLRTTEVRFISTQRDQDTKMIKERKGAYRSMTVKGGKQPLALTLGPDASYDVRQYDGRPGEEGQAEAAQAPRASWFKCGASGCACCKTRDEQEGFPKDCMCFCFRVTCLSRQHSSLIMAFLAGWAAFTAELGFFIAAAAKEQEVSGAPTAIITLGLVVLVQWSVLVLLAKFEELDIIQKLEREVEELSKQNQAVEKQSEKMRDFWNNAQNLTELWLYRTVPRLDLYKELHSQLEDVESEDLLTNISGANSALEDLENKLGALEAWRNDGALDTDDKKMFGRKVNQLCQLAEFDEILMQLQDDVIQGGVMQKMKALPQAT